MRTTEMELIEFLPGSLWLLSRQTTSSQSSPQQETETGTPPLPLPLHLTYIHVANEFPYQNFYSDYGPLHLAHVFAFARRLEAIGHAHDRANLSSDDNQCDADSLTPANARICVVTSMDPQHRANAVCVLGCWAILFKRWTADRAFTPFANLNLPSFHDASPHIDRFGLNVLDILRGLERAVQSELFPSNTDDFDVEAFLDDMDPEKWDLTWVTPRVAAFAGPQSQQHWCGRIPPQVYVQYFRAKGVTLIVRLNSPKYDTELFTCAGIKVVDLYFPDGTCPTETIVTQFLALCRSSTNTKIAVHCKAGLGRTGTLLACYLMETFQFSAEEAIGWLRLCRPGSVIGSQQYFLRALQPRLATLAVSKRVSPEDVCLTIENDDEQNLRKPTPPTTKGIATRMKTSTLLPGPITPPRVSPARPAQSPLLPPKIPGRRVAANASGSTQGDLLLLRKQAQQLQLPLGTSLWPAASHNPVIQ